jgi:hypothetical protein
LARNSIVSYRARLRYLSFAEIEQGQRIGESLYRPCEKIQLTRGAERNAFFILWER